MGLKEIEFPAQAYMLGYFMGMGAILEFGMRGTPLPYDGHG